jgi:hypothetical protein
LYLVNCARVFEDQVILQEKVLFVKSQVTAHCSKQGSA